jgi:hypothetical protein
MGLRVLVLTLVIAGMTVGCRSGAQGSEYVEGEVLVRFRSGVSEERMAEIHRALGNRVVESWPGIRWYRVLLKKGVAVPEGIQAYRSLSEVEDAEPNFRRRVEPPQAPPTRLPQ